ncbi:uncharacterized protein A4U43_C04F23590 [Asparagus officinalis]|uniref:glutathione transferase n=1 Tax=Asparagus officinalis TaxID=4686 RepID=A0A5P1F3T1_ASPOF|nr:glutathione S-transferase F10-like [Asparagus officinalis]ONK72822.1 uncharacterized protein A4U43_C04F23590 [Asparagus officinalis]
MAPAVTVFGSPTSSEVARVLTCLFEKNVEFRLVRADSFKGQKRQPDYLKLQPCGQALTFVDEGLTMVDSRAIIRHIGEKYADKGTKSLVGSGTLERASIEQWLLNEAQIFDPPSSALIFHLAFAPFAGVEEDEELVEQSEKKLINVLDVYEKRLGHSAYLAGNSFSLADLSHLPNAHKLMKIPRCRSMFESKGRVMKWWDMISSRTSWRKVVEMQKEPPMRVLSL